MDWTAAWTLDSMVRGSAVLRDGALERELRESILTACGQRGGLMTRATANQIDTGAAHRPPPFPTVLALDPMLLAEFIFGSDPGYGV